MKKCSRTVSSAPAHSPSLFSLSRGPPSPPGVGPLGRAGLRACRVGPSLPVSLPCGPARAAHLISSPSLTSRCRSRSPPNHAPFQIPASPRHHSPINVHGRDPPSHLLISAVSPFFPLSYVWKWSQYCQVGRRPNPIDSDPSSPPLAHINSPSPSLRVCPPVPPIFPFDLRTESSMPPYLP